MEDTKLFTHVYVYTQRRNMEASKVFEGALVLEIVVHYTKLKKESDGVTPPGLRVVAWWYSQTAYCS
jgi:hypothetical protein